MSIRMGLMITGFLLFFGGVNALLTRPVGSDGGDSNAASRSPASLEPKAQVIFEMAKFVSENPKILDKKQVPLPAKEKALGQVTHDSHAPRVLGVALDQATIEEFRSSEGQAKFLSQFQGVNQFDVAINDLMQAWFHVEKEDLVKREALLEVTGGLSTVSSEEKLKAVMLDEFDQHRGPENQVEKQDYAGKALQHYLDHEPDQAKKILELQKRGIPVVRIPEPSASPGVGPQ